MITIFNNASSFYWYPLKFNFQGGQFESIYQKYFFDNGMIFNGHNFLYQSMDYSVNNQTTIFLTDLLSSSEIFKNKEIPFEYSPLKKIIGPISEKDGYIITPTETVVYFGGNNLGGARRLILQKTDRKEFSDIDIIKITIDETDENLCFIENSFGLVLTCNSDVDFNCYFATKQKPYINNQRFEFFLNDDGYISFFLCGSNASRALTINSNNRLILSTVNFSNQSFRLPNEFIFKLQCFKKVKFDENRIIDSKIVEYNNKPINPIDSLIKDDDISKIKYNQNYLIMFPTYTPYIIDEEAVYNVDYCGLKNYQNPDYDYTKGPFFIEENPYIRRLYWKIHTGTNQENGYDNIYLSYTSNSTKISFNPDVETEFQYSPSCERLPLSSSNLIESGSIAGETPLTSDRIYGLSINYKNTAPGPSQPASFFRETGTWLCSWLKGTQVGKKEWMDRYYNSSYYTTNEALSSDTLKYNERLDPSKPYVYDLPSTMMLEPGARYKYFRQGRESSKQFLTYLDYTAENNRGSKILDVKSWDSSTLKDSSPYNNNGIIVNRNVLQDSNEYYIFNGDNHIILPSTSTLLETQKMTISMWLNVDDWSNVSGWQIFGNYYNGGWGLINNSGQISPLLTFIENKGKRSYSINYRAGLADSFDLSEYKNSKFEWVLRLPDFNYWMVDVNNFIAYKFDSNGKLITTDSGNIKRYIKNISQVLLDKDLNLVIYDNIEGQLLKLNQNGQSDNLSLKSGIYYKRIDFRNDNSIVYCDSDVGVIDNNNNLWEVVGENLYKLTDYDSNSNYYTNKKIKAHIGKCQNITCDSSNNLWLITKDNFLIKFETATEKFIFNKKLLDDFIDFCKLTDKSYPYSFINVIRTTSNEFYENCKPLQQKLYDIIVIVDVINFKIYFFQETGEVLKLIDLRSYIQDEELRFNMDWNFSCKGDFTGFSYLRKFSPFLEPSLSWKIKTSDHGKNNFEFVTLNYNLSSLPSNWHNFCMTFDGLDGTVNYYIDSIKVDSKKIKKNSIIHYEYLSPLLIAATTIKNTSLNDLLKIEDGYKFKGKISDLKLYNKCLNQAEVEQLYFSNNYSNDRGRINWNINVGERNYIEKINHFFKYNMPGNKSNYYNINIHNLNVSDKIKKLIEESIYNNMHKISPHNTFLNKINWI